MLDVTPDDWTFVLTAFIYLWQAAWIVYGFSLLFRKNEDGPFHLVFPVLPPIFYIVFAFALACNVAWLLIWDKQYIEVALVFINLMCCTLYVCLGICIRRTYENGAYLARCNLNKDIWVLRLLVQNGLGVYATWASVAAIFNFAVVITYGTSGISAKQDVGSTVSLIVFTLEILGWWVFDCFVFEKYLRYLFTPYSVVWTSLLGIITKTWDPTNRNSIYTATLLCLVTVLGLVKTILAGYRHYKQPLFTVPKAARSRRQMQDVSFEVRNLLET